MRKTKHYDSIFFSQITIDKAFIKMYEYYKSNNLLEDTTYFIGTNKLRLVKGATTIEFDSEEEFFSEYKNYPDYIFYDKYIGKSNIVITYNDQSTNVEVQDINRNVMEAVFNIFDNDLNLEVTKHIEKDKKELRIFIGHGHSQLWRELKDHLSDKHGYKIEAYEVGARAGHTIRDILDDMLIKSTLAFLVLTGEDVDNDGDLHARENVIHETGLFQGRLGFSKAIVLLEDGTKEFSNINGIEQIRFKKGNIKETFGDVISIINRENDIRKS